MKQEILLTHKKMKNLYKFLIILVITVTTISMDIFAQNPPSPPPPGHDATGNEPGGDAPISGGLYILLGLGVVYGGIKMYDLISDKLAE